MSDFTPSLDQLRSSYVARWYEQTVKQSKAEFDRAIAKVRAAAKMEALREAVSDFESFIGVGEFAELSQRGPMPWGHIEEAWEHQGPYMDWLRARADNLEAS